MSEIEIRASVHCGNGIVIPLEQWLGESPLAVENRQLRIEIAAAKRFGGGFYADCVEEETREVYRERARAALRGKT